MGSASTRTRAIVASIVTASMAVTVAVPTTSTVHAADPLTTEFATTMAELGAMVGAVSQIEELADAVPLTDVAPGGTEALDLLPALNTAMTTLAGTFADQAPDQLLDELEANDVSVGDVAIAFGCPAGSGDSCADPVGLVDDAGVIDYHIPISVTRSVTVPLVFESDVFDLAGQSFTIDFALSTAIDLRYDTTGVAEPFSLTTPPSIAVSVSTDSVPDLAASSRLGVTDVSVVLSGLAIDVDFAVTVVDPDGLDGLTRSEWMTTSIVDLVAETDGVTRAGTLVGSLALDTDLTAASPDGTIDIGDPDLSDGYDFTLDPAQLGALVDFTLISPAAIIAGIGQAAAGIGGAQAIGDLPLPFIDGAVRELAQASRPILDAIDALGVVCGTEGGIGNVTPAGSIEDLDAGTTVYCRAIVTTGVEPGSVTWTPVGASPVVSGAAADGTVGSTPTANVAFTMDAPGDFDVDVAYTATFDDDNDGVPDPGANEARTSTLPPSSLQDLAVELDALGGFDADPADLISYTPDDHAVRIDLAKSFDPDPVELPVNFGDQLEAGTGIAGLQAESGGVTADAGTVAIDLTAGVFLLPPDEWDQVTVGDGDCPDPSVTTGPCADALNLFFVEVDPGLHEFVVDDATFGLSNPTPKLTGRVGYLEVEAEVDSFGLAKSDPGAPVFAIDLEPGHDLKLDGVTVPNAISLRELLFDIVGRTNASDLNLAFTGSVSAKGLLDGVEFASASAGVTWDPVLVGQPVVDASGQTAFAEAFANFNPVPNLFGTHTGADAASVLTGAGSPNFSATAVGSRVTNLTDGSSCEIAAVTATTVTCDGTLAGGDDNTWQQDDLYRVELSSPLAMLEALLDQLDEIVAAIDNVSGAGLGDALDTELPVVGVSPRSLLSQIDDIRRTIDEIRQPAADVVCGTEHTGGTVTGDPSELVLNGGGTAVVHCNAFHTKPATDVVWSAETPAGFSAVVSPPADPTTTVGTPSDVVTITFSGPARATLPERNGDDGYQVDLGFVDIDGPHDAEYPSLAQPGSIQALADVIAEKLDLGDGFDLALDEIAGNDVVVLDLAVGRCNADALCPGAVNADPMTTSINADVGGVGGLVSASSDGDVAVNYDANARLRIALALTGGVPEVWVMPETMLELEGQFAATDLDFEAAFGPFAVLAGVSAVDDNGTPDDTADDRGGLGTVQLGAQLTVGGPAHITAPVELSTFLSGLGTYLVPEFSGTGTNNCGTIVLDRGADLADPSDDTTQELTGLGCAGVSIALGAGGTASYVADLGLVVDVVGGEFQITPHIPVDLAAQLAAAALDLELLLKALPEIIGSVESALRATASSDAGNGKIPLVGDALDAGADVAGKLREVAQAVVDSIPESVYDADSVDGLTTALQNFIYDELNGTGLLLKPDGTAITAATDIEVIAVCGGAPCDPTASLITIEDLRVIFAIGQIAEIQELPFDLGMDGVPLRLAGSIAPEATWHYVVDLGLSRSDGPYIGVSAPAGSTRGDTELALTAGVGLGSAPGECGAAPPAELGIAAYSQDRCLSGQIAFLSVNANDSESDPTGVEIEVGLDLTNGSEDTLGFNNAADVSLEPVVDIEANVDLLFRTGIAGGQSAGFPSVVGTFDLAWGFDGSTETTPLAVSFDDLHLDVGPLITEFIEPIASEIRRYTGPFQPVIDTLTAPIPVVSDLAELVGQPPVTLLGLMEVISGNDLSLIQSIAAFISFVNTPLSGTGYFPLGGGGAGGAFDVNASGAREAQGPTSAASLVENSNAATQSLLAMNPIGGSSNLASESSKAPPSTKADLPGTFGVPGLTFPFLDNPSQVFGLLLGQDITLVRYDFGPLEASAGFSYNFPPIMVGPVPIGIGVGGSVTVKGRFAVGYDTSGLRKVLSGGSGLYLFDGIFIDDLDANGVDVPEVSFIGEVYAQAGVTLGIASAGIVAGLRITVDLNLDDSPDPDGKLRIEEIFNKLQNPICLFDISGKLEAFIKAFVELDLFLVELRFDFTILELELLNFSGKCEPPKPVLAEVQGSTLVLNVGARAGQRNIAEDQIDESFTVRPINADGGFSVSAFGVYQTYGTGGEFDSGTAITAISADAADGDDELLMLPGGDQEEAPENPDDQPDGATPDNTEIPFSIGVTLSGGEGNDVLVGGDAVDTLNGNGGDDRLEGGPGGDTINGNAGNDTINGDEGNDQLFGGDDEDTIQGGPGNDTADGGAGADLVQGGPGTETPGGTDGDDDLAGGEGPDTVEGGTGDDKVFGDEKPAGFSDPGVCAGDTAAYGDPSDDGDKVSGGDGNDVVYGGHGDDELFGGSGNDLLCGNQGADLIDGDLGSATTETDTDADPQVDTSGGNDDAFGGTGNDSITGNWGHDFLNGNADVDTIHGDEGNDDISGGGAGDSLFGDAGFDVIVGDDATITQQSDPDKAGRAAAGPLVGLVSNVGVGSGGPDTIRGGDGGDAIWGEDGGDDIDGQDGDDIIFGNDGADNPVRGGKGADYMEGNADTDTMFGDSGDDEMYGNGAVDLMYGNAGDDYMEGNGDADVMFGDGGQDDMIGGSSMSGALDGADIMLGGALADVMVGDNGEIERPVGDAGEPEDPTVTIRDVTLYNVDDPTVGGGDLMRGGAANDRIFGGNKDDQLFGDDGRDLIEGNDGNDDIEGNDGPDRIAGGTSSRPLLFDSAMAPVDFDDARDRATVPADASGDTLQGNDGDDVIAGDNALVNIDGTVDMTAVATFDVFGADLINGNAGQDRLYGQLGGDIVYGDDDEDYIVGDLGFITPGAATGQWPGGAPVYDVDLTLPGPDVVGDGDPAGGADTIRGGEADDHAFGGVGDDLVMGNLGDDYLEGNGGQDSMYGNMAGVQSGDGDQDDMIGGSSSWTRSDDPRADVGETIMQGNGDHDVMLGDNGDIDRIVDGSEWAIDEVVPDARKRTVTLLDREKDPAGTLDAVSGGDHMQGNGGSDRMYGQGGSDLVQGNADDDFVQGNQGGDWLEGNGGEDDMIGGSSFYASMGGRPDVAPGVDPDDLGDPDGDDAIFGGGQADVITGDNAFIVRDTPGTRASGQYAATLAMAYFTTDHTDSVPGWWLGVGTDRLIVLLDREEGTTGRFGVDVISGGADQDVAFGQDGDDWASGGDDDDTLEGNGGADDLFGDLAPYAVPTPGIEANDEWGGSGLVSTGTDRDGAVGVHGEDDLVGGSNVTHRDGDDDVQGDGEDDFILGDNGTLERWIVSSAYQLHVGDGVKERIFRTATQLDPGTSSTDEFGDDALDGNDGDDAIWGQDGDDLLRGQADDDDLIGELGDDTMYGGTGEDAMVGDRGSILNSELGDPDALFSSPDTVESYNGPPFLTGVRYFAAGRFDRRVDLDLDVAGSVGGPIPGAADVPLVAPGIDEGGDDRMRGGPDHDSMHGAWGDDLMNGDQGGDYLFGSHGSDVMWGGYGDAGGTPELGADYVHVDRLFGGRGGDPSNDTGVITGGADVLDYKPRQGADAPYGTDDPAAWFEMTEPYTDGTADGGAEFDQHHHGTDWIYGGFDRDVMQGNVTDPGPNAGDRMWDWTGAFNLYTHCDPDYGGFNDQRARSPQMEAFIEVLAFDSGVGSSIGDVQDAASSAYRELALVYKKDTKGNNGKAYPTTPGHFDEIAACDIPPDTP